MMDFTTAPGVTPHRVPQMMGVAWHQSATQGERRLPYTGETSVRWPNQFPGMDLGIMVGKQWHWLRSGCPGSKRTATPTTLTTELYDARRSLKISTEERGQEDGRKERS